MRIALSNPTILTPEQDKLGTAAVAEAGAQAIARPGSLETWLCDHVNGVAAAILAAGFALRIYAAGKTFFNPDEVLHYLIVNQPSLWLAYKASLTNAHPPLFYVILYFWRFMARSEWMLRAPSVVAGTAFCWVAFQWLRTAFGKSQALIGLVLLAFSPSMVGLSAEVRAYALLLLCAAGALYFLSSALQEASVPKMWCFTLFLYLTILSHYSAVFFTVALGLYALGRFIEPGPSRKLIPHWLAGQAGALALYGVLYVTHVSKLKHNITIWAALFEKSYYEPSGGNIFAFTSEKTLAIFTFLFGSRLTGVLALLLFTAGAGFLLWRDLSSADRKSPLARMGLLLIVPFAAVWGASLAQIYPYSATRHTVFLAPFAVAGAAYALAAVTRKKLWAGLLVSFVLVAFSGIREIAAPGQETPQMMASAVNYMKQSIPKGDLILVDFLSYLPITYYFCGPQTTISMGFLEGSVFNSRCNGDAIASVHNWKMIASTFPAQFAKIARDNGLHAGDRVWVFQTGWGGTFDADLAKRDPKFLCLKPKLFGDDIAVMPFLVGEDFSPAPQPGNCADSQHGVSASANHPD